MNTKVKNIISVTLCVVLSVCTYAYLCIIVTPKDINDSGGALYYNGMGFLAEPKNSLDIVVYGNSDVYSGFAPAVLFEKFGYTSYASGRAHQNVGHINKLLKKTLKNQKPKLVILEADCFFAKSKQEINKADIVYAPFVYHSRWKEIKARDFYKLPSRKGRKDINKGYINSNKTNKSGWKENYMGNPNAKPKQIPERNLKYIEECIEICKANDIKVMLLELPSATSWTYAKHNAVNMLAKSHNIPFIDMNTELEGYEVDFKKDFRDNGNHLNKTGALKSTEYIGAFIKKNYSGLIKNKYNNPQYEHWLKVVESYNRK